jgi:hypothetical protein
VDGKRVVSIGQRRSMYGVCMQRVYPLIPEVGIIDKQLRTYEAQNTELWRSSSWHLPQERLRVCCR